jgi:hypothetical protein
MLPQFERLSNGDAEVSRWSLNSCPPYLSRAKSAPGRQGWFQTLALDFLAHPSSDLSSGLVRGALDWIISKVCVSFSRGNVFVPKK